MPMCNGSYFNFAEEIGLLEPLQIIFPLDIHLIYTQIIIFESFSSCLIYYLQLKYTLYDNSYCIVI